MVGPYIVRGHNGQGKGPSEDAITSLAARPLSRHRRASARTHGASAPSLVIAHRRNC